ncbi:MAG: hypothetical protein EBS98_07375, partial [Chitinophagia bacterium]|nr:hypothetical protein [Chitinophagia bacterium]
YVNNLNVSGNTILGDSTSDRVSFIGYVNTDIDPETNNTRDLGSNNLYWRNAYLGNLFNSGTLITIQSGTNIPALRITGSAITGASGISGYNYTGLYISIADNFITAPNRLVDIRGGANGLLQKFTIVIISTSLTLKNPF